MVQCSFSEPHLSHDNNFTLDSEDDFYWFWAQTNNYWNYLEHLFYFRMKIVKEHNDMAESLEEKKKSLMAQLEMVWVYYNRLQNTSVKRHNCPFF